MRLLISLFVSCSLAVLTSSVIINEECDLKSNIELDLKGSSMDVTFWFPDREALSNAASGDEATEDHMAPLVLEFKGYRNSMNYINTIQITSKEATVFSNAPEEDVVRSIVRNSSKTSYKFPKAIMAGWNTLTFFFSPYTVEIKLSETSMLIYEPRMTPEMVKISGSHIAVNCPQSLFQWHVSRKDMVIPLLPGALQHKLGLFSRGHAMPLFQLDSSNLTQLGWDGTNMNDQTSFPKEDQAPIFPFREHQLIISCQEAQEVSCEIQVGEELKVTLKTVHLVSLPKELSIRTLKDNFTLFYYIQEYKQEDELDSYLNVCNCSLWKIVAIGFMLISGFLSALCIGLGVLFYRKQSKTTLDLEERKIIEGNGSVTKSVKLRFIDREEQTQRRLSWKRHSPQNITPNTENEGLLY